MKRLLCYVLAAAVLTTGPVLAHHSFAMFDATKEVVISGTIKAVKWVNPHVFVEVMVPGQSGAQSWELEGGAPTLMARNGFTKNTLTSGMKVEVTLNPRRDGSHGGSLVAIKMPDGRKLSTKIGAKTVERSGPLGEGARA